MASTTVLNQRFDEAVELTDSDIDESVDTHALSQSQHRQTVAQSSSFSHQDQSTTADHQIDSPPDQHDTDFPPAEMSSPPVGGRRSGMRGAMDAPESDESGSVGGSESEMSMEAAPEGAQIASSRREGNMDSRSAHDGGMGDAADAEMSGSPAGSDANAGSGSAGAGPPGSVRLPKNSYDASEMADLDVPAQVKELFAHIQRYQPHDVQLQTRLKCFIPEFIPAIGDIDGMVKPDRPDGQEDILGLERVDEPGPVQSDPTVLDLQLRAMTKRSAMEPAAVRSIEQADRKPHEIDRWVRSISDLHKTKPPPQVHFSRPMPDVESLMQVWPPEFEDLLKGARMPGPDSDLSLEQLANVYAAILDIPVHDSPVQSLHLMFTLYNEFRNNQHFMAGAGLSGAASTSATGNEG